MGKNEYFQIKKICVDLFSGGTGPGEILVAGGPKILVGPRNSGGTWKAG